MKPFPLGKNATELGCKVGQKFVVVKSVNILYKKGDVLEFIEDDNSMYPIFRNVVTNRGFYAGWSDLAPYNPEPSWDNLTQDCVGMEFENKDGDRAIILEVGNSGKTFLRSCWSGNGYWQTEIWGTAHIEEANHRGWKLINPKPTCPECGQEIK